jgi:lipoprotein-anchoring transpeptidase ErfK/SrfK
MKKLCLTLLLPVLCGCVSSSSRNQGTVLSDEYNRPAAPSLVHTPDPYVPPPVVQARPYTPPIVTEQPVRVADPVMVQPAGPAAVAIDYKVVLGAQLALDRLNYSPGCLDGKMGGQTRAALAALREGQGVGGSDNALVAELAGSRAPIKSVLLSEKDVGGLVTVPASWPERAQLPRLDHETVLERIAEQYHATEAFIQQLNPGVAWPNPAVGTELQVPNTHRARSVRATRLVVNQETRTVRGYDAAGKLIAYFPCSIAAQMANRPAGETTVKNQAGDPNYTFDPDTFPEVSEAMKGTKRLVIPPGPNNPVGIAWVGLNLPGYGIHGTPKPERIGNAESHGCIRLANWNALKLAHMVSTGIPVAFE